MTSNEALTPCLRCAQYAIEAPIERLAEHRNWELSWGEIDGDLSECAWQVHAVNGGRNDREWTLIATGETPREALEDALSSIPEPLIMPLEGSK